MAHVRYLFVYKTRLFMMAHVPCPRRFRLLVESGSCRRLRCTGRGRAFSANGGTGPCTRAGAYHIRTACAPGFGCRGTSPSVRIRCQVLPAGRTGRKNLAPDSAVPDGFTQGLFRSAASTSFTSASTRRYIRDALFILSVSSRSFSLRCVICPS